jgi:hypothetical protein
LNAALSGSFSMADHYEECSIFDPARKPILEKEVKAEMAFKETKNYYLAENI